MPHLGGTRSTSRRHVGYTPPAAFSTNLQGCSAYRAESHWHYVSYDVRAPITGHPHVPDAPATGLTVWALTVDNPLLVTDPTRV